MNCDPASDNAVPLPGSRPAPEILALPHVHAPTPEAVTDSVRRGLETIRTLRWSRWNPPRPRDVAAMLARLAAESPGRARIAILGQVDVPSIGEFYFEPDVISATRLLGKRLFDVGCLLALLAFYALQWTRILPAWPISIRGFGYFWTMGLMMGGLWIWRSLIRPTYVRLAPGVVEFMSFRWFWHHRAEVRRYPMEDGTVVLVHHFPSFFEKAAATGSPARPDRRSRRRHPQAILVTFARDGRKDQIALQQMFHPKEFLERLWQALLSTAPIRRLSDGELLG